MAAAVLPCLGLAACMNANDGQQSVTPNAQHANRALEPGDPDYPQLASAPAQEVQFTVVMPSSLSGEFHLWYEVELDRGSGDASRSIRSAPGCRWTVANQFHVDLPVALEKSGNRYTGHFSPNLFEAGKCGWHFDHMQTSITNVPLVFMTHSFHTSPRPRPDLDLTSNTIHLWCMREPSSQVWATVPHQKGQKWSLLPNHTINCVPFAAVGFWTAVPDGLQETIPAAQMTQGSHIITQYLNTLNVEFHDFDAYASTYSENRKRASAEQDRAALN